MSKTCELCQNEYSTVSNLNKHIRRKHPNHLFTATDSEPNLYICDYCNTAYNVKKTLARHIDIHVSRRSTNIKCSFDKCDEIFKNMKSFTYHLESYHNENIEEELIDFGTIEDFNMWKKNIENQENCQYVRRTSKKSGHGVEYLYFDCHRSYSPRVASKGIKNSKPSIKIGKVCPSRIRIHKKENNLAVQFYSTHLWHGNDIRQPNTHKAIKFSSDGKLSEDESVSLNCNRESYYASNSTKNHENVAVSIKPQADQTKMNSDCNNKLYFEQDVSSTDVLHFMNNCIHLPPLEENINNVEANLDSQVKDKLEMVLALSNKINLSEGDQKQVINHCNKILSIYNINYLNSPPP